ncbi:MAG: uncharacterized protein PWQ57_2220 [Desulfovibrionales bacterium]|jgi:uncharacterized protein YqgC (DUF456 family)|nr:uncharacterized protein [Desulfovibrionales bacterium]
MDIVWALLFILLLFGVLLINIFQMPANWIILALLAVWKLTHAQGGVTWLFVLVLLGLAMVGEILEFLAQAKGAQKYGASKRGNLGGIIGAIVGAIAGAPFLLGIGALLGALAGAFLGCFVFEKMAGRKTDEAWRASWGAFWGKMFGMTAKAALGAAMIGLSIPRIWP